jgi:hypothetical protein
METKKSTRGNYVQFVAKSVEFWWMVGGNLWNLSNGYQIFGLKITPNSDFLLHFLDLCMKLIWNKRFRNSSAFLVSIIGCGGHKVHQHFL